MLVVTFDMFAMMPGPEPARVPVQLVKMMWYHVQIPLRSEWSMMSCYFGACALPSPPAAPGGCNLTAPGNLILIRATVDVMKQLVKERTQLQQTAGNGADAVSRIDHDQAPRSRLRSM